jgi:hypothetical protein
MASVYIETSIPSFYYETRTTPQAVTWRAATREWWDRHRSNYTLFTSEYVVAELSLAPHAKAAKALHLIRGIPWATKLPGLEAVVQYYLENQLMPRDTSGDVFHLAMASMHGFDFLATWNCRHLANANKVQHLTVLNGRLGLRVPIITTPLALMSEVSDEEK